MSDVTAPSSILFMCNLNAIRSPMAEGLARRRLGPRRLIASCGLWEGGYLDACMIQVMAEAGVAMSEHTPRTIDEVVVSDFELIISLTPESRARVEEAASAFPAISTEHWSLPDPTHETYSHEARLVSYRATRDDLTERIARRFNVAVA